MLRKQLGLTEREQQRRPRTACCDGVSKVWGGLIVAPLVVGLPCERLRLLAVLTGHQDRQHQTESHVTNLPAVSYQLSAISRRCFNSQTELVAGSWKLVAGSSFQNVARRPIWSRRAPMPTPNI